MTFFIFQRNYFCVVSPGRGDRNGLIRMDKWTFSFDTIKKLLKSFPPFLRQLILLFSSQEIAQNSFAIWEFSFCHNFLSSLVSLSFNFHRKLGSCIPEQFAWISLQWTLHTGMTDKRIWSHAELVAPRDPIQLFAFRCQPKFFSHRELVYATHSMLDN